MADQHISFGGRSLNPDAWIPASRKRIFLALYIDYLVVSSGWALLQYALQQAMPKVQTLPVSGKWILFFVLELAVINWEAPSLGAAGLSMRRFACRTTDSIGRLLKGKPWFVEAWVKRNESWLSMIAAVLFINEGVKSAVRWTMWNPPQPLFGSMLDPALSTIVYMVDGALEIWIGYLILKLNKQGLLLGLGYLSLQAVSVVTSWELWDPFTKALTEQRSAYLGTGNTEAKIRFLQSIMPEAIIVYIVLMAGFLAVLLFKFRQIPPRPKAAVLEAGELVGEEE